MVCSVVPVVDVKVIVGLVYNNTLPITVTYSLRFKISPVTNGIPLTAKLCNCSPPQGDPTSTVTL